MLDHRQQMEFITNFNFYEGSKAAQLHGMGLQLL